MELEAKKKGRLIIVSGPSGVGKSSLTDDALKDLEGFERSVSVTTRPRRKNEVDGYKYNFISKEDFDNLIKKDKLLEWAKYCDFQYGTPLDFVEEKLKQGKNVILEIEVQGAMQVKKKIKDAYLIFIVTSNISDLKKRLKNRDTESEDNIEKRLKAAGQELKYQCYYDCIIVNNDYNEALLNLKQVLLLQKEAV
ncbi:MAG TPA: guanylate kinase [Candidatus Humimicrobiaceae bacterium]